LNAIEYEGLPVQAALAERRDYELDEDFDVVVSIGLLMFFDRPTAFKALSNPQAHIRQGGIAVGNVPFDGTTYLYMFDADSYRLFRRTELESRFSGWRILYSEFSDFDAADGQRKAFATITAPRPLAVPEP